jgi:phosphoglycolate phosphatase-like HAD superfamily hydrolase
VHLVKRIIRAVLFDWDGTLVNTLDVKIHNAGRLFQQVFEISPEKVEYAYRVHSGVPRRQLFDSILADFNFTPLNDDLFLTLSRSFSDMNRAVLKDRSQTGLVPIDTPKILIHLTQTGCLLYVSSSADTQEIREMAAVLGLADYFNGSGGEIFGSRPGFNKGSQHVDYICTKNQLNKDELIFIGDDLADIRLGKEAGVFTIARVGTLTLDRLKEGKPDAILNSLYELINLEGIIFEKAGNR